MKKLCLLLFTALFFVACGSDKGDRKPLVTDVDLSFQSFILQPGTEIAVYAKGYQQFDEVFIRLSGSILRAYVTEVEPTFIRFITPGGLPAGEADILLKRGGDFMLLGQVELTNGLAPKDFSLYAIDRNRSYIIGVDMESGDVDLLETIGLERNLTNVINSPGTNRIFGVNIIGGKRNTACWDLAMKRFLICDATDVVTTGIFGTGPFALCDVGSNKVSLRLFAETGQITRTSVVHAYPVWKLPEGITPQMLTAYPFISLPHILLAADKGDGSFVPVGLSSYDDPDAYWGESVEADAMVPFLITYTGESSTYPQGGYAVARNGKTELRGFNFLSMMFNTQPIAEIPGTVISCATLYGEEGKATTLYLLSREDTGTRIYTCDLTAADPSTTVKVLTDFYPMTEIVLAR